MLSVFLKVFSCFMPLIFQLKFNADFPKLVEKWEYIGKAKEPAPYLCCLIEVFNHVFCFNWLSLLQQTGIAGLISS